MSTQNLEENIKKLFKLISATRLRESTRNDRDNVLMATESDKARVVNAASFRRLQQKAQVFPLETNAAVRSRLTHSIEVSQVGRYIVQEIIRIINEKCNINDLLNPNHESNNIIYETLASFSNTVETACLLHDIGNPPFGHLGEAAIQQWFAKKNSSQSEGLTYVYLPFFDGNAQGLRLVNFLSGQDNFGLNLTCSTLLAMIKYPKTLGHEPKKYKGIFGNDLKFCYEVCCTKVEWPINKIFPFALLMEAADDIAYCTSDLEDGLEKGVIKEIQLKKEFPDLYPDIPEIEDKSVLDRFIQFKTRIINVAVQETATNFIDQLHNILDEKITDKIELLNSQNETLENIKKFARENIYNNPKIEEIELAGYNIINGLLDSYNLILDLKQSDFDSLIAENYKDLPFEARLFKSIPSAYRNKYKMAKEYFKCNPKESSLPPPLLEINLRAQMIVDFISGMTDDFALEKYQILKGINL